MPSTPKTWKAVLVSSVPEHRLSDAHLEGRLGVEALDGLVGRYRAHLHRRVLQATRERESRSRRCEHDCGVDGADKAGRELHSS